ncbi:MAG TPA: c-type cytochrome [Gammaproteobacteria bacterium]|nr:c-type cytochrome [Gammaproteobacteria bacterium]
MARAVAACLVIVVPWLSTAARADGVPIDDVAWAYAVGPAAPAPAPSANAPGSAQGAGTPAAVPTAAAAPAPAPRYSLPGGARTFTLAEIANRFGPADWYPADHPAMPKIVAAGRMEAGIWACGLCHYPNGKGRPENAALAGLPKDYIVQQLHDFGAGLRGSAEPRKANTGLMIGFARAMTEDEIQQAAEYFSSMRWTPWIEVVETDTVPKTRLSGGMHLRVDGPNAGTEPIGRRIIESPRDTEHTERLRDPRSDFIAYVPPGSVEKGKGLATTGGTTTIACVICHGQDLGGLALVPPLRGRSPSYIARQLYDFQQGTRHGTWAPLMAAVVKRLTSEDIVDLSAYIASLPVQTSETTARNGAP